MNIDMITLLPFLALPFIVNAVFQATRGKHRLGGFGTMLALIALAGPLAALTLIGDEALLFVVINGLAVLILSGFVLATELRQPHRDLNRSMGVTGLIVAGLLMISLFAVGPTLGLMGGGQTTDNLQTTGAELGGFDSLNEGRATGQLPNLAEDALPADIDPTRAAQIAARMTQRAEQESGPVELEVASAATPSFAAGGTEEEPEATPEPARETNPMPTPTPTRVPLEYVLPTFAPELGLEPVCDVTTTANLNIRSGPSTSDDILTSVTPDTRLSVIGQTDTGDWLEVRYLGLNGWVSAEFVLGMSACVNLG